MSAVLLFESGPVGLTDAQANESMGLKRVKTGGYSPSQVLDTFLSSAYVH